MCRECNHKLYLPLWRRLIAALWVGLYFGLGQPDLYPGLSSESAGGQACDWFTLHHNWRVLLLALTAAALLGSARGFPWAKAFAAVALAGFATCFCFSGAPVGVPGFGNAALAGLSLVAHLCLLLALSLPFMTKPTTGNTSRPLPPQTK